MRLDSSYATVANDETLASTDTFTLKHIDIAVEVAKSPSSGVPIRPMNIMPKQGGDKIEGGKYIMFLHPYQVTSLRTSTDTGQWLDIQKAAMQGGMTSKNPIFTGALGMYNNVILKEAEHVTQGVDSSAGDAETDVRRAVLVGAQACGLAFGMATNGLSSFKWNEELLDHKRRLEVSVFTMMGMKKQQFRSADHSCIVVPTYAAASV